jgi:hypothetical protein
MALVNFTNLDFDQIKTSIKDYLRSNSNFTDYDFEGSNLSVLIDTLAYNTYISSYNANMVSNEVFIDSATLRENVVSLARNIGYVPRSRKSSQANISFFVDTTNFTTNPITLTLQKGLVCTSSSLFGSESYTFSIPDDITVPVVNGIASFDSIVVYEGTYLTTNFTVNPNFPTPPQRYILENANIDTSTIRVIVKDTSTSTNSRKFNLASNIFNVTSTSQVFFVQEIEDQRYELIFGDGVIGEKLDNLNYIEVQYNVSNGENANGVNSFAYNGRILDNNGNIVTNGISLITTNIASEGGKEIESVSSIKSYATRVYAAQNRAVTSLDYEALIPQIYPEAESVSVFGGEELDPPQFGRVYIAIKPFYGPFVPNSIKDNLKRELRNYAVAGIIPEITDLKFLYIEVDSTVYYNSNQAPGADFVKTLVTNSVNKYADSIELNKYGARFKYSKYQKIVDDSHSSITSNITKVQIRRDLRASINELAQYEICYGNSFHVKNVNGYNIKSSGFKIDGVTDTVYLGDIPDSASNYTKGNLILFNLTASSQPTVVRRSVGTIDYEKGEILINPLIILSTEKSIGSDSFIEIAAVPKSNDVIGLQDLYLQLDINKSTINMLSDEISSGSDPSGSNYTTTSSYTNGALVRS